MQPNCLKGRRHGLIRSPGINRKSMVSDPGPGYPYSATWPSLPKKNYNGLINQSTHFLDSTIYYLQNSHVTGVLMVTTNIPTAAAPSFINVWIMRSTTICVEPGPSLTAWSARATFRTTRGHVTRPARELPLTPPHAIHDRNHDG